MRRRCCQRVGLPHQDHEAAAFARPEAVRARIEDPHLTRSQGAGLGESHQLERVEAQIHAAGQRHVDIAGGQRRAGVVTASSDDAQAPSTV